MSGDWTPEVARTRAWREAPYRFAPLRHALTAGVLLAGGIAVELAGGPEAVAVAAFAAALVGHGATARVDGRLAWVGSPELAGALRLGRRATGISRQKLLFSVALLAVLIPSAVLGLLTVVAAVAIHELAELLAVGNGVRAARRPAHDPA